MEKIAIQIVHCLLYDSDMKFWEDHPTDSVNIALVVLSCEARCIPVKNGSLQEACNLSCL